MAENEVGNVESSRASNPPEGPHDVNGGDNQPQNFHGRRGRLPKRRGGPLHGFEPKGPRMQHSSGEFHPPSSGRQGDRNFYEKLMELEGPTYELPPVPAEEKKFSGRSRLYIGNISAEIENDDILELFKPYGETSELFLNREKNFGFIRVDYHFNAERAKNELNGKVVKGRTLKIRFAPNSSTIKVKNLDDSVTNELLYHAFSIFGEIDRCVVVVDDHGKSLCEGIVEFSRKNHAQFAVRKCQEESFFLTASVRPVFVEPYVAPDETDGYSEKFLSRRNPEYLAQRKLGPRFAKPDSFEDEYGVRWKRLHELYRQRRDALRREREIEEGKLVAQMEFARYEHDTAMLREQLRVREMDLGRHKREWELKERRAEEARRQREDVEQWLAHQDEVVPPLMDALPPPPEAGAFEQGGFEAGGFEQGGFEEAAAGPFASAFERPNRFQRGGGARGARGRGTRGRRAGDGRDFAKKRRRL